MPDAAPPTPAPPVHPHARILVVDDEHANLVLLQRVLERAGYIQVRTTGDSKVVLAMLDSWLPDLVLLDLMMPPPDGFEILSRIAERPAPSRMPVLVLTAGGMPEVKARAFHLGASDFVTKPFDQAEVLLRIRNLLETRFLEVALRDQNEALELRVTQRTSALTQSLDELQRSMDERQVLVARLVSAQEEERRRIAGDIHDDTMQTMVAAALRLEHLRRASTDVALTAEYESLLGNVREAIARLRNLLFDVHPASLERDGLAASIRSYLERMQTNGGPPFNLEVDLREEPTPEARATLYRIAQEALTNVRKHASATRLDVGLRRDEDGFTLRIRDDGTGFDPASVERPEEGHLGMTTMHERARVVGGAVHVESRPGAGTVVEVRLPHGLTASGPAAPAHDPDRSAAGRVA